LFPVVAIVAASGAGRPTGPRAEGKEKEEEEEEEEEMEAAVEVEVQWGA